MTVLVSSHAFGTAIHECIVRHYARLVGILTDVPGFCVHSLRKTARTNALDNGTDIAKVQDWLGHADASTT